jgi:hypothetical protein
MIEKGAEKCNREIQEKDKQVKVKESKVNGKVRISPAKIDQVEIQANSVRWRSNLRLKSLNVVGVERHLNFKKNLTSTRPIAGKSQSR